MPTSQANGLNYAVFTGGVAGAAKDRPGFLGKVVVTANVTGAITIHDNATAASGPILYASAATPTAGTVVDLGVRAKFGIFVTPGSAGTVLVAFE